MLKANHTSNVASQTLQEKVWSEESCCRRGRRDEELTEEYVYSNDHSCTCPTRIFSRFWVVVNLSSLEKEMYGVDCGTLHQLVGTDLGWATTAAMEMQESRVAYLAYTGWVTPARRV